VGIGLAGFLLAPMFDVPAAFGNLLEMGFEGGHGTVGGMRDNFVLHGWEDGVALGITVATIGMISGIVIGMGLVNWAYSRGYIKTVRPFHKRTLHERRGIHAQTERPSAGKQTVLADSVDSLAWHIAIIGIAVLIGYGILEGLQKLEIACFPDYKTRLFAGFPLFPLCMLGGVILQIVTKFIKVDLLVDRAQMERISGAALDCLALAAVATINVAVVAQNWLPLLIIIIAGLIFCVFTVIFIAPRLFKEAWFERAIADFGQATGVTATGLMLLRTVDPENKTIAASSFGYKQLIHEPFMGGGLWTALALPLVYTIGWVPVFVISCIALLIWAVAAFFIIRSNRKH
jgi:ESS family glutamate:Na+ symporter